MDHNLTTLLNRCQLVENTVNNIAKKYSGLPDPRLQADLGRLVNRAREYEHGTFIILVVGPAKSGKSTLVNLIAGAYVSPTSFLECTVRPSVISRHEEGQPSSLTVYSGNGNDTKLEQIDSIIDIIRGFGSEEELSGVICEKLPLTDDNIRRHVQLGLEKSLDSENLLTSIRTPGGRLLQDRVFVIDMPGFDGAYQNIDNPVYETIAQRADLIIFVQSSNAAFSKVSKEFLNILAHNNRNVPVCLVHNIFDAAWWRDADTKKADIETQRNFACDKIREMGFRIDRDHSFCINLGAVEDYRKGIRDAEGKLEAASAEYDVMEQKMFDSIINHRDAMRLTNSLSRVAQQRDKIVERAHLRIDTLRELTERYDAERRTLDTLKEQLPITAPALPAPDTALINQTILQEYNTHYNGINHSIKKSNSEATETINNFIAAIDTALNNEIDTIFKISTIADDLFARYRNHLTDLESTLAVYPAVNRATVSSKLVPEINEKFDVAAHINIANIVPKKKIVKIINGSHSGKEIGEYMGLIYQMLLPAQRPGEGPDPGILARTDVRRISRAVQQAVDQAVAHYNNELTVFYTAARTAILANILPHPEQTTEELKTLTDLCTDLKKLTV